MKRCSTAIRAMGICCAAMGVAALMIAAPAGAAVQKFGPYAGSSTDSSTCGSDWATDTFKRVFTVVDNGNGTFTVTEDFISGSFTTFAGPSPASCGAGTSNTLAAGITGNFNGTETGTFTPAGTYNPNATCPSPCTTAGFIDAAFGAGSSGAFLAGISTFKFNYHAAAPHMLARNWQNASTDQGGNQGDIASS